MTPWIQTMLTALGLLLAMLGILDYALQKRYTTDALFGPWCIGLAILCIAAVTAFGRW